MKQLTYLEVGAELGVHPYHVRRIIKRYPRLIKPIVEGYNRVSFKLSHVRAVKRQRRLEAQRRGKR